MNMLLIFFAIPIAIVILSVILETYMKCAVKVAGIFFSILIVVAFAFFGTVEAIVAVLVYTILSFVAAYITRLIMNRSCSRNYGGYGDSCYKFPNYNLLNTNLEGINCVNAETTTTSAINNFENETFSSNNMCRRCR